MATIDVTDADFEEKVLKSNLPVLVDFWAPWCGPCRMVGPVLEELSEEYEGNVLVAKVNIDDNQGSAKKYGVMSIPTAVLFKDGQEVDRQIGFSGKQAFEELMKKTL